MSSAPALAQSWMSSTASAIDTAMQFPMHAVVARYAKDHDLPMLVAEEHATELRRYLALCGLHPDASYGMRGPIDDVWHTFILFTQDYAEFCDRVAGRFLHHEPGSATGGAQPHDAATMPGKPSILQGYVRFLADYEIVFGEVPPRHLWPRPMPHETAETRFEGCGCGTCYCHAGGCSCAIAIAYNPVER